VRRLTRVFLVLLLAWLALWGGLSLAAPTIVDQVVGQMLPRIQSERLAVDSLNYGNVEVSPSLLDLSFDDLSAVFDLAPTDAIQLSSSFQAERLAVHLSNLLQMRGNLELENFEVSFHETDRPRRLPFDRLTDGTLCIENLPLLAPRKAVLEVLTGLEDLFLDNKLVGNFEFSGLVQVQLREVTYPARIYTEHLGDQYRLRFSRPDLESMVEAADVDLSPEQIEIISLYPIRVPLLFDITRQARQMANDYFPNDHWTRDALRHLVWSYRLTEEFGPEFALEVTNAQETRVGNTPSERAMDFHNNAIGRQFAANGTQLMQLPVLVQSHPDVIRHPDEVDSRAELLY
jgi:hypothetical protein